MDFFIKKVKDNYLSICIYVFWFLIAICVPFGGDDWEVSNWHIEGISRTFWGMVKAWTYLSGRISNNVGVAILTYHRWAWNLLSAFIHTTTIFLVTQIFTKNKAKKLIIFSLTIYLCIGNQLRAETQFYITGNISYTICICMIFYYIYTIERSKKSNTLSLFQNRILNFVFWTIYCCIGSLWIENLTIGYGTYIVIEIFLFLKTKNQNMYYKDVLFGGFSGNFLGIIIMFTSMGISNRIDNSITLVETIKRNYYSLIEHLVLSNLTVYALCCLAILLTIKTNGIDIKHKLYKITYYIFLYAIIFFSLLDSIIPILSISGFRVGILGKIQHALHYNIILSTLITILVLGSLLIAILISQNKTLMLTLYISAFFSVAPMIMAPGARNMLFAIWIVIGIATYFMSIINFKSLDINKCYWIAILFILTLRIENYAYCLKDAVYIENQRKEIIKTCVTENYKYKNEDDYYLVLPSHRDEFIGNLNSTYYSNGIINHFKLPQGTKILFDDGFLIENIELNISADNIAKIHINQLQRHNSSYAYYYTIYCNGELVQSFDEINKKDIFVPLEKSGLYIAKCTIQNNITGETTDIESEVYEVDIR